MYGAFPTDPYSHTPSFAGARQPGMTGQVKEDFLARLGELGAQVVAGRLRLGPSPAGPLHWRDTPTTTECGSPAWLRSTPRRRVWMR